MTDQLSVLVTGSSGFSGRPLLNRLRARGHSVVGLTRTPETPDEAFADLTDRASIDDLLTQVQPDVVVHLAGISSPAHPDIAEIYSANVMGGLHLLEAIAGASKMPRMVIVASSGTIYQPTDTGSPIDEDCPTNPINHYAISKRCLEEASHLFGRALPIQLVRPFNYTGPGQPTNFFVPKVVEHFALRRPVLKVGNLDVVRDISALDDVIEVYVRLIEHGIAGEPLNICSGRGVRLADLVSAVSRLSGHELEIQKNPAFIREGEPKVVVGSRARLDARIGAWELMSMDRLLSQMLDQYPR